MEQKTRDFCQIDVKFQLSIPKNNLRMEVALTIGYNRDTDFGFNFQYTQKKLRLICRAQAKDEHLGDMCLNENI